MINIEEFKQKFNSGKMELGITEEDLKENEERLKNHEILKVKVKETNESPNPNFEEMITILK